MANRILTSNTYWDEVRGRLGVDMNTISNGDIDSPSILPIAEAKVVMRVPDYANLSGDNKSFVYAAAVCMVAALLAPSMNSRLKKSESDTDYKYENQAIDWSARARELEDEAYGWINYISTQPVVELPQYGVSGPTRKNESQGKTTPFSGNISLYPTNIQ